MPLPGHPESFQLEPASSRIFANIPDARQIAVIDRESRSVVTKWPMEKFHANFPMALDDASHRLFIGCRSPSRLVIIDVITGKSVADVAISGDTDDLFYDARLKRIYLSCGEGFIDVVDQNGADSYQLHERIPTRTGARTTFFSQEFDQLYLAIPQHGNLPAELRVFHTQK